VSHENHPDHQTLMAEFHAASDAIAEALLKLTQQDWAEQRSVTSNDVTILHQPLDRFSGYSMWMSYTTGANSLLTCGHWEPQFRLSMDHQATSRDCRFEYGLIRS
jgi:hypothetical protein